jgi:LPXTG-site transpeptidase (sortase) family protein
MSVASSDAARRRRPAFPALLLALLILLSAVVLAGCGRNSAEAASNEREAAAEVAVVEAAVADAAAAPEAASAEVASAAAAAPEAPAAERPAAAAQGGLRSAAESAPANVPQGAVSAEIAESIATANAPKALEPLQVGAFASKAILPPDRLELPSIGLDTSVIELGWTSKTLDTGEIYSEWEDADNAAGWHKNSQRPGFGGNVVLSGHNNIMGAVFRELDLLKRGDTAYLYVDHQKFEYVVDKVLIVPEKFATEEQRQKNFAYIEQSDDERLTLVSCWPRDDNTHRIIVVARPVASSIVK